MSKKDPFTGRDPATGNTRSHSLAATRRRWNINLQWTTLNIDGQKVRVRLSTKTLRSLRKGQKKAKAQAAVNKPEAKPVAAPEVKEAAQPVEAEKPAEKVEPEQK